MNKKLARQMSAKLTETLNDKTFLGRSGLSRRTVLSLMNREYWSGPLERMLPIAGRLTCQEILELCREPLSHICREPEEGWMKFTYQYACHILYPDEDFTADASFCGAGALFFLAVLQVFFDWEREALPFDPLVDFEFLDDEETEPFESADEYRRFKKTFRSDYVYEMMRLNGEVTPFKTLEHIAGVHYVAMTVARGLRLAGAPIDLALTSGAAAGHDLGKFGCKPHERVPYLHYYYTNQWFKNHQMEYMGHIAANHSTWDLEPENLSVESLVLIYADFRVKQSREGDGRELTNISSLEDAFGIILSKLDQVDAAKLLRYRFVYSRLHDFEDYMRFLGVDVSLGGGAEPVKQMPDIALRNTDETVQSLIFMGIGHNISVMHRMAAERQFGNLLEAARSEKNWKNVRAYLNIFEEYFTYTNDTQKEQTLDFLYELFMHREGDIRTQAAGLLGNVIARFNAGYRKERPAALPDTAREKVQKLWKAYLKKMIRPDHKLTNRHKSRIRYNLKLALGSVLEYASLSDVDQFLKTFLAWYKNPDRLEEEEAFALLDAAHYLPFERCSDADLSQLAAFAVSHGEDEEVRMRIAAWRVFGLLTAYAPEKPCGRRIARFVKGGAFDENITMAFLQYGVLCNLGKDTGPLRERLYGRDVVSDIFLENLKLSVPWVIKAVNIKLLSDQTEEGNEAHLLHIAAHLSNLLKASEHVAVRHDAGKALLTLLPRLTADQRNEIVVELLKGLEMGAYEISKYIPGYLGQAALWLPPEQLDEIFSYLRGLLASPDDRIVSMALDTAGVLLEYYPLYGARFKEQPEQGTGRQSRLLGMLLNGLANYREAVRQEALLVIGKTVFGSGRLCSREKQEIFSHCLKKLLFLLNENQGGELTSFYRAAALSNICRFITVFRLEHGVFEREECRRVAFFPGTFDPFTLSHKGIVEEIRDMGFEVYLAVDEFSWSKKVQPHQIRRQIVSMSVADQFHVNLFPDDIPVNLSNPGDLKRLREVFDGRELYIVVGSDVIAHASSYQSPASGDSIHSMNHIAFWRSGDEERDGHLSRRLMDIITGEVITLKLPEHLEDISSTRIRENIDLNRDISNLIDQTVQEFIYYNGLYLREPEYKPILRARAIAFEEITDPDSELLAELSERVIREEAGREELLSFVKNSGCRLLLLRNTMDGDRLVGFSVIRYIAPEELITVLKKVNLADLVRRHTSGEILLISGIYVERDPMIHDAYQLLLTETIARSLACRCGFALFFPAPGRCPKRLISAIERQGFVKAPEFRETAPLFLADMHAPLVLVQNLETTLKEPFSSSPKVLSAVNKAHQELQLAMTRLYPGQLVLSLSASVIHHRLVDQITALNGVSGEPAGSKRPGPYMCVPFGKILRGKVVPNTVTKTLHTDKVFEPDLSRDAIEAFPYYSPLRSQIKAIKSFDRPVILVDDLLHRGGRFEALEPIFMEEGVKIRKLLLGMISGYGRDTMTTKGVDVDSVYYIPNLRYWFVESTLYPFIGGDTVRRSTMQAAGLVPSINMILPYTALPLDDCDQEAAFEFSACCIRNSRNILLSLEAEYRTLFSRNLTLARLSEAVILPLCPDKGGCVSYDPNLAASVYLDNDLQQLSRIRRMVHRTGG